MLSQTFLQRQNIVITLVSTLISIVIAVLYYILRIGFDFNSIQDVVTSAGLASFIILFPTVLFLLLNRNSNSPAIWYTSDPFITILLIGALGLTGFLINDIAVGLSYMISILAGTFGLIVIFYYFRFHFRKKDIWFGLLTAIFATYLSFQFWGGEYHHPLFFEKIALGAAHADTLFHASTVNMIKTFSIPGNGIDNQDYMSYHWGSHLLFAGLSKLSGVDTLKFYNQFYPVIFIPLFFKSMLHAVLNFRLSSNLSIQLRGTFIIILIVFIGIMPVLVGLPFTSESNAIALLWLMFLSSVIIMFFGTQTQINKITWNHALFIIFLTAGIGFLGLMKIPIAYLFMAGFGYIYLRKGWYRSLMPNILFLSLIVVSLIDFRLVFAAEFVTDNEGINVKTLIKGLSTSWHESGFILFYFWSILLIIWLLAKKGVLRIHDLIAGIKQKKLLLIELIVLICLAGYLPAPFLDFNAYYFTFFQNYFSFLLLLMLLPSLIDENKLFYFNTSHSRIGPYLVVFILLVTWFSKVNIIQQSLGKNFLIRAELIAKKTEITGDNSEFTIQNLKGGNLKNYLYEPGAAILTNPAYQCILQLKSLESLTPDEKKSICVYIPKTNRIYWDMQHFRKHGISFCAPALTEMVLIDGLPDSHIPLGYGYQNKEYFYSSLTEDEMFQKAKESGFVKVIILRESEGICQLEEKIL